jgi:hypothetical protein
VVGERDERLDRDGVNSRIGHLQVKDELLDAGVIFSKMVLRIELLLLSVLR